MYEEGRWRVRTRKKDQPARHPEILADGFFSPGFDLGPSPLGSLGNLLPSCGRKHSFLGAVQAGIRRASQCLSCGSYPIQLVMQPSQLLFERTSSLPKAESTLSNSRATSATFDTSAPTEIASPPLSMIA